MTDEDLFTTFTTAPERLIGVIDELVLLPWNTGADSTAEHVIAGTAVTSSEDADLHELDVLRSRSFAGDGGERLAAAVDRAAPVVARTIEAATSAWGDPSVIRRAADLTARTLLDVFMGIVGVDEVLT